MPLRELRVSAVQTTVYLHGRVPTYHMKQLAQATAMAVAPALHVCNEIDVVTL